MILSYLYNIEELNKMADGIIVSLYDYSFSQPGMFSVSDILKIKSITDKPLFLNINPLYHDKDLLSLKEIIRKLKDIDGFLFQDLGLVEFFKEYNILNKAIYYPETFNTTYLDSLFFKKLDISKLVLSREITLDDINDILLKDKDTSYFYSSFGHQMMFYSLRPHISNYVKKFDIKCDMSSPFDFNIKELSRSEHYNIVEDNLGFRCYKDKIFNGFEELSNMSNLYLILDRIFINDDMYFDAVKLFKKELSLDDFYKKYNKDSFDKSYLFKETGLLK